MEPIVCATRGGEGSRAVQRQAIQYAKENDRSLVFLYVLDTSHMGQMEQSLLAAVRAELTWVGKAMITAAQHRARAENIEAQIVIREGSVETEIGRFVKETGASLLLLGAPRGTTPHFGDDTVEKFAISIRDETGVSVKVVRPDPITIETEHELLISGEENAEIKG